MLAAKEKNLNLLPIARRSTMASVRVHQPAATTTPTVFNRISSYDFRARKFSKPPIGTSEKFHPIVPVAKHQQPRKSIGENIVHLRRLHQAPEMSLYRAYFAPGDMDPYGLQEEKEEKYGCKHLKTSFSATIDSIEGDEFKDEILKLALEQLKKEVAKGDKEEEEDKCTENEVACVPEDVPTRCCWTFIGTFHTRTNLTITIKAKMTGGREFTVGGKGTKIKTDFTAVGKCVPIDEECPKVGPLEQTGPVEEEEKVIEVFLHFA